MPRALNGLFAADAPSSANLNLLIQVSMAIILTIGMILARRKLYRAHAWTQSSVLLLNLVPIGTIMVPSFHRQVSPHVVSGWHDAYYAVAIVHAALGTCAELLGLYVVLAAGTKILPDRLRFENYKLWMRTTLALWWLVVLLGGGVYSVWYVERAGSVKGGPPVPGPAAATTVTVTNFRFEPKQVRVRAGDTVLWVHVKGRHAIVADDGSFRSPTLTSGARFQQKFAKPGVYNYYCRFHGDRGGQDMAGTVLVQ